MAGFEGTQTRDGTVRLTWRTASETGNAGFRVQRRVADASTPGVRRVAGRERGGGGAWTRVGFVEGSGTTDQPRSYRFTDTELPYEADRLEYRLQQVDTDGTTHLTGPVVVERDAVKRLKIEKTFPNPTQGRLTIQYAVPEGTDTKSVTMRLYDVLGRAVRTVTAESKAGRHERQFSVQDLAGGVYVLRLEAGGQTCTRRLTVVR